jgi:hypothetical protein
MATLSSTPAENPGFLAGWDWFWFAPRNPTTLGLIRIFTGLILLYIHLSYSFGLMEFVHPEKAWVDRPAFEYLRNESPSYGVSNDWYPPTSADRLAPGQFSWSIYFHLEDDTAIWAVHIFFILAMALFTLGLWTRLTSVLTWIGVLQYVERSQQTLFGMDSMIVLAAFYLMIGPAGAALSLDHWLARRRERLLRGDPNYRLPVEPSLLANLAIRLMQVQFCLMYFAAGTAKLLGSTWWGGTALWGTVANYEFAPFYVPGYESALRALAQNRPLWEFAMTSGAIFTLALELGFPFVVWYPPMRWVMVTGAVMLHTGIGVLMGLTTFSLIMLALVASFIPSEAVEKVLARLQRLLPPKRAATTA